MTRGVLYMVWPDESGAVPDNVHAAIGRSVTSLLAAMPDLDQAVEAMPAGSNLLSKTQMYDLSPFDTTLFLDADTVVLGDLTFGFEQAEKHGMACCICENPWLRRYGQAEGDGVEYNSGVVFFSQTASPIFHRWKELAPQTPDLIHAGGVMPGNDQWSFSKAIAGAYRQPFILPLNWNFRRAWHSSAFGPVKIWHDYGDPPQPFLDWNSEQAKPGEVIEYARFA